MRRRRVPGRDRGREEIGSQSLHNGIVAPAGRKSLGVR